MTNLLIDGDILLYQVSSALEEPVHWGDDWWTLMVDFAAAKQKVDKEIEKLMKRLKADTVIVALSDPTHNFRKDILDTYKGNRKGKRKPVVYTPLKEYVREHYTSACFPGLEADDVLGIMADEDNIVVSDDKDLQTVPGRLYRPSRDKLEVITEEEADRNHLIQTLTGDATDNYSGCPGIGPVRAQRILVENTWDEVVQAFDKQGLGEAAALIQARVAKILRLENWNPLTMEVIPWNPK